MDEAQERYRIGFDIGGTFTDFVLADSKSGTIQLHKCLTTPHAPSEGVLQGLSDLLSEANLALSDITQLIHGTTLVTNAIIERKGAKVGLLTTHGFRDILEFGHEQRYDIHDLFLSFPDALVPRRRRIEIEERMNRDGDVVTPIDMEQVGEAVSSLVDDGITSIAVCFLHSYKNPEHERAARDMVASQFPDLNISISSEVQPQLREYERTSTTVANAYVQPLAKKYLAELESAFVERGFQGRFYMIQSSGGLVSPSVAAEYPVRLLESGPAGGGQATAFVGRLIERDDVISFDMGGTTAKACLIEKGEASIAPMMEAGRIHRFKKGSGMPIVAPVIDMIEIGAGGGSIAWVNSLGLLKVGPESSGANPGPACYGVRGENNSGRMTVTDANLLLGYLNPDYFLGGRMKLDIAAAQEAISPICEKLSMEPIEAAWGIYDIVCENMAAAARVHIVEKGHDPRRFSMVALGGAGPAHAACVARKLGVREVIVPPASGAASALGFLVAPLSFDISRSLPCKLDNLDFDTINRTLDDLERETHKLISTAEVDESELEVQRRADMRLFGQMHEISVPIPDGSLTPEKLETVRANFVEEYTRRYSDLYEGAQIQVLNWNVECKTRTPRSTFDLALDDVEADSSIGNRSAYFGAGEGFLEAKVVDRYALRPGDTIEGPAIIEERESTTVVPPGDTMTVDDQFNLRVNVDVNKKQAEPISSRATIQEKVAEIESDPIGLEIMWSRLINITEECAETVIRTAFSLIIGQAQDFACEVLDAKGNQLAHSPRSMPVFNISLPMAVNAMIERFPVEKLDPGDILVTNDPWLCAGHLFDVALVMPVFRDGKVVALMGVVGHISDIGGTKDSLRAREIYEEGLQIPPMKFCRAGVMNQDLLELIKENVRNSDQVIGDLHALVSACRLGTERICEFMDDYAMRDLEALAKVVQGRAEQAMRDAIAKLPDGIYDGEIWNDGLGTPERYPVSISVKRDELEVDFEGAPEQQQQGAGNCTLTYTVAHTSYPLKCVLSPEVPGNAGCYRPFNIKVPKHSILNCDKPLAVNMRVRTGWYIAANIFNAIAPAAAEAVQSFTGLPGSALFYGTEEDGHVFNDHLFQGGGQGAWHNGDGKSGLLWPTSAGNTSVELFETRVPVLVLEKSLIPNSGGAGKMRGGLGQRLRARKLYRDKRLTHVGLYPNGVSLPVDGLFGGKPGALASARVFDATGRVLNDVGIGALITLHDPNEIVELCLGGGSGFGEPEERNRGVLDRDIADGYVTRDQIEWDYEPRST